MNLWRLFPESILCIKGILYLPYLALIFYIFVLFILFKCPEYRMKIIFFILLTVFTNIISIMILGPSIGVVMIPLLLLLIMIIPIIWLISSCLERHKKNMIIGCVVTITGWLHSLSWVVWVYALSNS